MVALFRDAEGATITQIAAELGISDVTLSAWCKAAGVPIRHRKPGSVTASVQRAGHSAVGGQGSTTNGSHG